jgi:hypothetical protein
MLDAAAETLQPASVRMDDLGRASRSKEDEGLLLGFWQAAPLSIWQRPCQFAVEMDHAQPDSLPIVDSPRTPNRVQVVATMVFESMYSCECAT